MQRRRFLRWSLVGFLLATLLAYGTVVAWFMANEVTLVFAANRTAHAIPADLDGRIEQVTRTTRGGTEALLWVMRQEEPTRPWVLFLHGNAANVSTPGNVTRYRQLHSLGLNVVAPEYPGFGVLGGEASEATAAAAAYDAWEWLVSSGVATDEVAIYGWSLGSGVATDLAARVPERAVVLEGAFTGVDDRARELYPWLPVGLMIRNRFASRDRIAAIGSPLLLLHARDDEIIPFAHGERLLEAAREPKRLVALTGGHIHPNVRDERRYMAALSTFFDGHFGHRGAAPAMPPAAAAPR